MQQAETAVNKENKSNTIIIRLLIHLLRFQVRVQKVDKCSFAVEKFLIRANLRNSTINHHNDLIQLRQKADAVGD